MNLPSQSFQPRVYGLGAWTDNLHFAYDLVATTKPRLLVELGSDRGESYFAFCQAVAEQRTGTRCFAIDTWRGDHQTGSYDETTFAEVAACNESSYAAFSTLLRSTFDAARERFVPESIDLLHIDGLHTEAAVRHDFETWLPKVAPGGIVLLHDVCVRTRDFGVWKLWEELCSHGRSSTFANGPGLGVWQKPPETTLSEPLETLLGGANSGREELAEYYRARAAELQAKLARQWQDGTIRQTALAHQTALQVFYSRDGTHSEENSVNTRVGHEEWTDLTIALPHGAGAAPLRLDFLSTFTVVDLSVIRLTSEVGTHFLAEDAADFARITVAGDAERLPHPSQLRVKVTGVDPQLYFPPLQIPPETKRLQLTLRLRVSAREPVDH
jgi:hypothetical protein